MKKDEDGLYTCDPMKNKDCKKTSCWYEHFDGECYRTLNEEFATDEPRFRVLAKYMEVKNRE